MQTLLRYEFYQAHRPVETRIPCHWCTQRPDSLFAYHWTEWTEDGPKEGPAVDTIPGFCRPACYSAYLEHQAR